MAFSEDFFRENLDFFLFAPREVSNWWIVSETGSHFNVCWALHGYLDMRLDTLLEFVISR